MQESQDIYDNFTVSYTYDGPCSNEISTTDLITENNFMTVTGLEEFSNYTLIVYAVNSAGRSLPNASNTIKSTTQAAGI